MVDQDRQLSRLVSAQLIIALLAGGAYFLYDRPFESSRVPSGQNTDMFEARLWEDPLNTIYGIRAVADQQSISGDSDDLVSYLKSQRIDVENFRNTVHQNRSATNQQQVNLIGVMMPEGQHSLTIETRRRIRYAVISALNQSKIPTQSERLSLVATGSMDDPDLARKIVSYEIYQPYNEGNNGRRAKSTVVLWLPANLVSGDVAGNFQQLAESLGFADSPSSDVDAIAVSRAILLGPTSSNELVDMAFYHQSNSFVSDYTRLVTQNIPPESSERTNSQERDSLIVRAGEIADNYLDFGLVADNRRLLEACLFEVDLNYETVSGCMQNLNIDDSDEQWHDWVARNWDSQRRAREALRRSGLESEQQRQVLDLIDNIHWYAEMGTPAGPVEGSYEQQLVQCLDTPQNLDLPSGGVRDCLEELKLPNADSDWARWAVEDWTMYSDFEQQFSIPDFDPVEPERPALSRDSIVVLSPRATIPDLILQEETRRLQNKGTLGGNVRVPGLHRTLDADDRLLFAMRDELIARNIKTDDPIALIYEGDGKYGRALQQILDCNSKFTRDLNEQYTRSGRDEKVACFEKVDSFAYLRGLDGIRPEDNVSQQDSDNGSSGGMSALLSSSESLEESFGRHQYDYLRRLSNNISSNTYKAIGVLGTDVYDKLLVLQALREKNQHAVFFTTDLDAVALHGRQFNWTQNLLVAAAMPLSLNAQGDSYGNSCNYLFGSDGSGINAAPFREGYQTAYFQSVCLGLHVSELETPPTDEYINGIVRDKLQFQTKVYEVGRTNPVLLPGVSDAGQQNQQPVSLKQAVEASLGWLTLMLPTILLFSLSFLAWNRERSRGESIDKHVITVPGALGISAVLSFAALLFMSLLLLLEYYYEGGEPLQIMEGVSHWPTTLFRLQVVVFSITFGLYSYARWIKSTLELDQLVFSGSGSGRVRPQNMPQSITGWIHRIDSDNESGQKSISIEEIWNIYREFGRLGLRLRRVIPKAVLWTLIVYVSYYFLTPHPALIRDSYWLADVIFSHEFIFVITVISLLVISLANDVTNLSRIFVKALSDYKIIWEHPQAHLLPTNFGGYMEICKPLYVLELIAKRTRDITPLVIFPFGTLLLIMISRSVLFEGWNWSIELIFAYLIIAATSLYYAMLLQKEAASARTQALHDLEQLRTEKDKWSSKEIQHDHFDTCVKAGIDHARNLNKGAFVPWFRHPIFQAVLLPFTGTPLLLILQSL